MNPDQTYVKVGLTDLNGTLLSKYIHRNKFKSALKHGLGFCSVIFGWDYQDQCYPNSLTGWETGYHDLTSQVDLSTQRQLPWESPIGQNFYLADFPNSQICPRNLLKSIINQFKVSYQLQPMMALEYEWYNLVETHQTLFEKNYQNLTPLTHGSHGYSASKLAQFYQFSQKLLDQLEVARVQIEGLHCEAGPGVLEVALQYGPALEMADQGVLFKHAVKAIGAEFGILPTFMARYDDQTPGSGCHIHQSLWEEEIGENVFVDQDSSSFFLSSTFCHYLAGLLHCLPEILPMFAPNVNSYKRLVDGFWAPTRIGWARENRTVPFRVIYDHKNPSATRIECRVAGADTNPYLILAACLASGLYGIRHSLELPPPVKGNAYQSEGLPQLSTNLYEASVKMRDSKIARELFGDQFVDLYTQSRLWEWEQSQKVVNLWERRRYLEIV